MSAHHVLDVKLHVMWVEEHNYRHTLATNALPPELEPFLNELVMKRTNDPDPEIIIFYEPFLGKIEAFPGPRMSFKLDTDSWKLYFAPKASDFVAEPSMELSYNQALLKRLYLSTEHKNKEQQLYYCTDISIPEAGKRRAKVLNVSRLIASTLPVSELPSDHKWPDSELYENVKVTDLQLAVPKQYCPSGKELGSSFEALPHSPSSGGHLVDRLRSSAHDIVHGFDVSLARLTTGTSPC